MKEEEKALLSFTDKDGNNREIFEKDLNDRVQTSFGGKKSNGGFKKPSKNLRLQHLERGN